MLSIKKEIVDRVKIYAKQNGQSLSSIIEDFLKIMTEEDPVEIMQLTKSLLGSFKAPLSFDYKMICPKSYLRNIYNKLDNNFSL